MRALVCLCVNKGSFRDLSVCLSDCLVPPNDAVLSGVAANEFNGGRKGAMAVPVDVDCAERTTANLAN